MDNRDFLKIVKSAIRDEVEAVVFYKLAARITESKSASKIFEKLALDELDHLNRLTTTFKVDVAFSEKEIDQMETKNTKKLKKKIGKSTIAGDAIKIAMEEEEKAVDGYRKLYEAEKDPKIRKLFKELVEIEKEHGTMLRVELERDTAKQGS